jgi:hypothetical protein
MNRIGIALAGAVVLVGGSYCVSSVAHSSNAVKTPPDGLAQVCENVVISASRGEKSALDLTNENSAWRPKSAWEKELQEVRYQNQLRDLAGFQERFGAFLGCEFVEQKDLSASVRICTYLAKYEQITIRWTFLLYRPHDKWKILNVRFKDLMTDLFPQN